MVENEKSNLKNVISYCLWGDQPKYWIGALRNIELCKKYFPGWICRFYIDKTCKKELIDTICGDMVEVKLMAPTEYKYSNHSSRFNHPGLFWRFLSLSEENERVIFRDCDSRFSQREVNAVNEWIISEKKFHIMRDHPYHGVPILAGMWGCKGGIRNIDVLLENWKNHSPKGIYSADDQDFLGQIIYPQTTKDSLEHSEFGLNFGSEIHPFPDERVDFEFVGDIYDEDDLRHPDYWKIIKNLKKI